MEEKINNLKQELLKETGEINDLNSYNLVNAKYKKEIKNLYATLKTLPVEEKKIIGALINELKKEIEELLKTKSATIIEKKVSTNIDLSIYNDSVKLGVKHPLISVYEKMERTLLSMGFDIIQGPEIELDRNNFEMLNMANDHPARDMQDTFYLNAPDVLIRSHTSAV